jgi:hypothetical protein
MRAREVTPVNAPLGACTGLRSVVRPRPAKVLQVDDALLKQALKSAIDRETTSQGKKVALFS